MDEFCGCVHDEVAAQERLADAGIRWVRCAEVSPEELRRLRNNDQALRAWKGSLDKHVAEGLPLVNGGKGTGEPQVRDVLEAMRGLLQATVSLLGVIELEEVEQDG